MMVSIFIQGILYALESRQADLEKAQGRMVGLLTKYLPQVTK